MLITRAYSTYLSKFPIKEPPSKFPSRPEMPIPRAFYTISFIKPSKGSPLPGSPLRAPIERDAPYPKHTFTYL
jgi:hypothetical protein